MLGTIVNALAIIAGGVLGLLIKGRLKENIRVTLMQGVALSCVIIGLSGAVETLIGKEVAIPVYILSLAIGGLIGAIADIDMRFNTFALFVERKLARGKGGIAKGFITGTILYCVGTMAIVGSIESGALAKHDILYTKSVLDGITAIIIGATMGSGIVLSAVSVFAYQGVITLVAGLVSPYLTGNMMNQISVIGGVLVFAIGLNLLDITKIKLANFLPALFMPILYYAVIGVFS